MYQCIFVEQVVPNKDTNFITIHPEAYDIHNPNKSSMRTHTLAREPVHVGRLLQVQLSP